MSYMLKKEMNNPMWSWTARFIEGTDIVLATSCENITEIYKYDRDNLTQLYKNYKCENIEDFICGVLEDEDLLNECIEKSYLILIDTIK